MEATREELVNEQVAATYEGKTYILLRKCNGQKMKNLEKAVKELIAENDLTVTQAKGFLEYMRIVIEGYSRLLYWDKEIIAQKGEMMNEMKFSYAPESLEDEYAFLAGRVTALEDYLDTIDSSFVDVVAVRKILGIGGEKENG